MSTQQVIGMTTDTFSAYADKHYIINVYKALRRIGLLRTQYDYSTAYLNRSKHYYSMILSNEERNPSIDSIHTLLHCLARKRNILEEDKISNHTEIRVLNNLIEKGKNILMDRMLKYI